jgi:hypothetical protein
MFALIAEADFVNARYAHTQNAGQVLVAIISPLRKSGFTRNILIMKLLNLLALPSQSALNNAKKYD